MKPMVGNSEKLTTSIKQNQGTIYYWTVNLQKVRAATASGTKQYGFIS